MVRREEPAAELIIDHLRALRVLGLPRGASPEDIKTAWRDLAKVWHPDRFPSDERLRLKAGENLKRINEAHESLGDYDPAEQPRISARIRASVSVVLGMGELGEPPREPGVPIPATGPIGVRRSRRILGLGRVRSTDEMEAIEAGSRFARVAMVIALVVVIGAAIAYYLLYLRPR